MLSPYRLPMFRWLSALPVIAVLTMAGCSSSDSAGSSLVDPTQPDSTLPDSTLPAATETTVAAEPSTTVPPQATTTSQAAITETSELAQSESLPLASPLQGSQDECFLVGESDYTSTFLGDASELFACPDDSFRIQEILEEYGDQSMRPGESVHVLETGIDGWTVLIHNY